MAVAHHGNAVLDPHDLSIFADIAFFVYDTPDFAGEHPLRKFRILEHVIRVGYRSKVAVCQFFLRVSRDAAIGIVCQDETPRRVYKGYTDRRSCKGALTAEIVKKFVFHREFFPPAERQSM